MRVVVITPPASVVSLEDAKSHLEVEHNDDDAKIEGFIAGAVGRIDGPDGWLGRAIGVQTLEARFNLQLYRDCITLPFPPIVELVSVKYLDQQGVLQTADPADFELFGGDMMPTGPQWAWATTGATQRREAVRVQYRAGYEALPAAIRVAILLMVGDLYRNRETVAAGTITRVPMSTTVEDLLEPFWKPAR